MAPKHISHRLLRRRMRRTLYYGQQRMNQLTAPLNEAAESYFSAYSPYDRLSGKFANKLSRDACVAPCSLIVAMIYLDRLRERDRAFFEEQEPDDLYLGALVCAGKWLHDDSEPEFVYNDEWAASAACSTAKVHRLEMLMLQKLDWHLNVSTEEFDMRLTRLEKWTAWQQMKRRPSGATYAELDVLTEDTVDDSSSASISSPSVFCNLSHELIRPIAALLAASAMAYTASVLGLLGFSLCLRSLPNSPCDNAAQLLHNPGADIIHARHTLAELPSEACPSVLRISPEMQNNESDRWNMIWSNDAYQQKNKPKANTKHDVNFAPSITDRHRLMTSEILPSNPILMDNENCTIFAFFAVS